MLKVVSSFKPGRYVRRQVVRKGMWVDVRGFLLLPVGKGARRWVGLARVTRGHVPQPKTQAYLKHGPHRKPEKVDYDPTRPIAVRVIEGGARLEFTAKNGARATFKMPGRAAE